MTNVIYSNEFENNEKLVDYLTEDETDVLVFIEQERINREFIVSIRKSFPKVRIIYVFDNYQPEEEHFLHQWIVFDIVMKHDKEQIDQLIKQPMTFWQALDYLHAHGKHVDCRYCNFIRECNERMMKKSKGND